MSSSRPRVNLSRRQFSISCSSLLAVGATLAPLRGASAAGRAPDVGVFYFPAWTPRNWADIKGLPNSRSPNHPWPNREPLLGYYDIGDVKVTEQQIDWASQYGVTFFAYDWYWDGKKALDNPPLNNFMKAPNNGKMQFSLLWANHGDFPRSLAEFDMMVDHWLDHYFKHPRYYKIDQKPSVFVFSAEGLEKDARQFGWHANDLIARADKAAVARGLPGIFFVGLTNARPNTPLQRRMGALGFSAYTGWNYISGDNKSLRADYSTMVDTYLDFYASAGTTSGSPRYIPAATPGWDPRPWRGDATLARTDPTPQKFETMLRAARRLIDEKPNSVMNLVMIESWNEFGEGSYIEPTKEWNFDYLKAISQALK